MLTKRQVLFCLKTINGNTKEKKKLLASVQASSKEFYTDAEVQELQKVLYDQKNTGYPDSRAERDAYDSVYRDSVWHSAAESDYNYYDGQYDDIWN